MQNTNPNSILKALISLTFIALVTVLPSWHFMSKVVVWFMDGQRLLELLLLSLILLDATLNRLKKSNSLTTELHIISNKIRYAFFVLLGFAIISSYLAQSPRRAIIEVSVFAGLSYLALFIGRQYIDNKEVFLRRLIYALWASILLYMVSFYVGYFTAVFFKTTLIWPFPFNGFSNIRHFNQYQLWGLGLICLPLLGYELKKTARTWLHIGLIFWWVLLFYSASRGVLLAWFVGMFITALVYQKSARPFLRLQLIQITAGFLSYILLFKAIPALLNYTLVTGTVLRDSASDRLGLWRQALLLVNESPLFGVGPMHFAWHYDTSAHPHNSVLQLAAEFGLPATLIVLLIASYGIYCWLKRFNVSSLRTQSAVDKHLIIILFFTIVSNALYSLVDGVIVMPISQVLMFTVIGLMIGHYAYGPKTNDENKSKFRPIIAGFVLLTMLWSTLPEITQGLSGNEKGFSMGYTAAGPRFWREIK